MMFEKYMAILLEWNEKFNLTSITDPREIEIKHFEDSLSLFETGLISNNERVIDIGSGAGFPGIPIKIKNPKLKITLLDSLNKRVGFLNHVISELGLKDIKAIHGRAEELARDMGFREKYDIATARAVSNLSTLLEYSLPFVKVGGHFIAMKGSNINEEVESSRNALRELKGSIIEIKKISLPPDITHHLIVIRKEGMLSKKYPRGQGKPKKNPL